MNRRILMLVNTQVNLITCIHIRKKMFASQTVDLIISSPVLKNIYETVDLHSVFDTVRYVDLSAYQQSLKYFFSPKAALVEILGEKPQKYSDVFFWNPDSLFYNYYKYLCRSTKFHVYTDGIGGYLGLPLRFDRYSNRLKGKIMSTLDSILFRYSTAERAATDVYIYKPEYMQFSTKLQTIELPPISKSEMEELNELFKFEVHHTGEKYIFLDVARDGFVKNEDVIDLIQRIQEIVGRDNLLVRAHPRVDPNIYAELNIKVMNPNVFWEPFYFANCEEDISVIALMSSATVMPFLMFDKMMNTLIIKDVFPNNHYYYKEIDGVHMLVSQNGDGKMLFAHSVPEVERVLSEIEKCSQ